LADGTNPVDLSPQFEDNCGWKENLVVCLALALGTLQVGDPE